MPRQRRGKHFQDETGIHNEIEKFTKCASYYNLLQGQFQINNKLGDKLKAPLESMKEKDKRESSCFGNLLTTIYLQHNDMENGKKLNSDIRERFKDNLYAKYLYAKILCKQGDLQDAKTVVSEMKEIINSDEPQVKLESAVVEADFGYALAQLAPSFYSQATAAYESALSSLVDTNATCPRPDDRRKIIWSYFLLQTYNKLMNHGNIKAQQQPSDLTPETCFEKICKLVPNILWESSITHTTYQARTYIELHDSYKKVQKSGGASLLHGLDGVTHEPDEWLKKALDLANDDGHVLERLGRHFRTIANKFEDFKKAAELLEKCATLYPTRHVTLHQLGLCYRSMWIDEDDLPEAELHRNNVRSGRDNKRYGNKKKKRRDRPSDNMADLAEQVGRENNKISYKKSRNRRRHQKNKSAFMESNFDEPENAGRDDKLNYSQNAVADDEVNDECSDEGFEEVKDPLCNQVESVTLNQAASTIPSSGDNEIPEPVLQLPNVSKTTFAPNQKVKFGQLPKTYNKPDYYDILRTSNPSPRSGVSTVTPKYLLLAIEKMELANKCVQNPCSKYLTDLGRLYVSTNEEVKALDCFGKAKVCTSATDHDNAYACEQFALLKETQFNTKFRQISKLTDDDYDNAIDDVISAYRQAVIYSVRARVKSKRSFYQLKTILNSQINFYMEKSKTCTDDVYKEDLDLYQEEMTLLNIWVENLQKNRGSANDFVENLHLQWELVYSFKRYGDYLSAYYYLKLLFDSDKIRDYIEMWEKDYKGHHDNPYPRNEPIDIEQCLEICLKVAEEQNLSLGNSENTIYKDIFRNLCEYVYAKYSKDVSFGSRTHDIIIISEDESEDLQELNELLRSFSGLSTFSQEDILSADAPGHKFSNNIDLAKSVIILSDEVMDEGDKTGKLWRLADEMINDKKFNHQPKIYASWKADNENNRNNQIPCLTIERDCCDKDATQKHQLISQLFKSLFIDYPCNILSDTSK